jgi:CheY-like chemotaxis protein
MSQLSALIIDDNPNNVLVLQQLLSIEGVGSTTFAATDAFAQQMDKCPNLDLIFLDLEMPKINGYQALEVIRSQPRFANTRVIAYSVYATELNNALDMGFDGFLGKPLSAEEFPMHLAQIMQGQRVVYIP